MPFYTDKAYTSKFLDKNVGLEKMVTSRRTPASERNEGRNFGGRRRSPDYDRKPLNMRTGETPEPSRPITVSSLERFEDRRRYQHPDIYDSKIAPGSYSYISLRQRMPSVERKTPAPDSSRSRFYKPPMTPSRNLHFTETKPTSTRNMTLLIKPRKNLENSEDLLPVEVLAVEGRGRNCNAKERDESPVEYRRPRYTYPDENSGYSTDKSFSHHFLRNNKHLAEMIRRVEDY